MTKAFFEACSENFGRSKSTGRAGRSSSSTLVGDCNNNNNSTRSSRSASDDTISVLTMETDYSEKGDTNRNSHNSDNNHRNGNSSDHNVYKEGGASTGTPTTVSTGNSGSESNSKYDIQNGSLDSSFSFPTPISPSPRNNRPQSLGDFVSNTNNGSSSKINTCASVDSSIVGSGDEESLNRREVHRSRRGGRSQSTSDANSIASMHSSMPVLSPTLQTPATARPNGMEERMRKRLSERRLRGSSSADAATDNNNAPRSPTRPSMRKNGAASERHLSSASSNSRRSERMRLSSMGRSERGLRTTATSERGNRSVALNDASSPQLRIAASSERNHRSLSLKEATLQEETSVDSPKTSASTPQSSNVTSSVGSGERRRRSRSSRDDRRSLRGDRSSTSSTGGSERGDGTTGSGSRSKSTERRGGSLRGERSTSRPRQSSFGHMSMTNLGSISERSSRRHSRRQSSDRHLTSQSQPLSRSSWDQVGSENLEDKRESSEDDKSKDSLKITDQELYDESVETNRKLQTQMERQAKLLSEKDEQIQKLLADQKAASEPKQAKADKSMETDDDEDEEGEDSEKDAMRTELKQLKATMSKMFQDNEKAEKRWKKRLDRAHANRPDKGVSEEDVAALRAEIRELQLDREDAEADWKKQLEKAQQRAASKEAALLQAVGRIADLEEEQQQLQQQRQHDAPTPNLSSAATTTEVETPSIIPLSPPPKATTEGSKATGGMIRLKQDRMERESFLVQMAQSKKERVSSMRGVSVQGSHEHDLEDMSESGSAFDDSAIGSIGKHDEESHDNKHSKQVKKLQNDIKKLKSILQAKEEEVEKLQLTVAKLEDSEWGMDQDLVKLKEDYELAMEELEVNQLKLNRLQEVNGTLFTTMAETEAELDAVKYELHELKEAERIRKQEEYERKQQEWERKVEEQGKQPSNSSLVISDEDEAASMASSNHSSQAVFISAAMTKRSGSVNSTDNNNTSSGRLSWGALSGIFVKDPAGGGADHQSPRKPQLLRQTTEEYLQLQKLQDENAMLKLEIAQMKTFYKEESDRNHQKLAEIKKMFQMHQALAMAAAREKESMEEAGEE